MDWLLFSKPESDVGTDADPISHVHCVHRQILKCEIKMQDYQKLLESFYFIYS